MTIVNPNRAARIMGFFVCLFFIAALEGTIIADWPAALSQPEQLVMAVLIPILLVGFTAMDTPWVRLTGQGVEVRYLLMKRFFPWKEIAQAGIMQDSGKGEYYQYPMILIIKQRTTIKRGFLFKLCNFGNFVKMPGSPEIKQFVNSFYGKLDFDETLGRRY